MTGRGIPAGECWPHQVVIGHPIVHGCCSLLPFSMCVVLWVRVCRCLRHPGGSRVAQALHSKECFSSVLAFPYHPYTGTLSATNICRRHRFAPADMFV
jgi:hypothetical protein